MDGADEVRMTEQADAGGDAGGGAAGGAEIEAALRAALEERDARIASLEGEIAEAARTAESAERLRAEMDELRRAGDEQRVGFELQIAGARNVKAARALLPDYDNDVDKLRAGEPWLFESGSAAQRATRSTGAMRSWAARGLRFPTTRTRRST